jgi:coenzyme PQQ biosynthesis protein PqqD
MSPHCPIHRPLLVRHARFRWDELRRQHQIVFPEGILVLNETAAAVVRLCDGRSTGEVVAALEAQFPGAHLAGDVSELLQRLAEKGLVRDADA